MGAWGQVLGEETHFGNMGSIRHRELVLGGGRVSEWRPGQGHPTLGRDRMLRG